LVHTYDLKKEAVNKQYDALVKHNENCINVEKSNHQIWSQETQSSERIEKTSKEIDHCIEERPALIDYPIDLSFTFATLSGMQQAINSLGTFVSIPLKSGKTIEYKNCEATEEELAKFGSAAQSKKLFKIPNIKNPLLNYDKTSRRIQLEFRLDPQSDEKNNEAYSKLWFNVQCCANNNGGNIDDWESISSLIDKATELNQVPSENDNKQNKKYKYSIDHEFNDNNNRYIHVRLRVSNFSDDKLSPGEWCSEIYTVLEPEIVKKTKRNS